MMQIPARDNIPFMRVVEDIAITLSETQAISYSLGGSSDGEVSLSSGAVEKWSKAMGWVLVDLGFAGNLYYARTVDDTVSSLPLSKDEILRIKKKWENKSAGPGPSKPDWRNTTGHVLGSSIKEDKRNLRQTTVSSSSSVPSTIREAENSPFFIDLSATPLIGHLVYNDEALNLKVFDSVHHYASAWIIEEKADAELHILFHNGHKTWEKILPVAFDSYYLFENGAIIKGKLH